MCIECTFVSSILRLYTGYWLSVCVAYLLAGLLVGLLVYRPREEAASI